MCGELVEYVGQGAPCGRQLVLQRVVVLLLQDAAGEGLLDEVLHQLQVHRTASDPQDHRVAVTEPMDKKTTQKQGLAFQRVSSYMTPNTRCFLFLSRRQRDANPEQEVRS